ncbi:MAG TPA: GNAT family N-acetyltransferase [Candidatus Egerieicola pullicola]|uniref:GNAT family N-acetyltransferase n=1 Tax=Candidatus Egerieicola pullicola TaxID=2840775 RepID=A0A9D1AJZ6_9FIRM|nr:GNAT family N-acetyltransferase [Candidatus Egerieicola pullicola]
MEKRSASFFLSNWEGEIIDALFLSSTSAPQKLADLRKAVGWNGMEDLYSNPSLTSFITLRCMSTTLSSVIWTASLSNGVTDAYIQDLMVHLDYQGQGIGTELMNKITAFLKSNIYLSFECCTINR